MEDLKIKAAKDYYDSVGMTTEQITETIETLGFEKSSGSVYYRKPYAISIEEYNVFKYQVIVECTNLGSGVKNTLINPRYANQIQQLIKNTQ